VDVRLHSLLDTFVRLQNVSVSIVISVCPSARRYSGSAGRIFIKIFTLSYFKRVQLSFKLTIIRVTSHEDLCTFVIISC
jgi:hypothetical protein